MPLRFEAMIPKYSWSKRLPGIEAGMQRFRAMTPLASGRVGENVWVTALVALQVGSDVPSGQTLSGNIQTLILDESGDVQVESRGVTSTRIRWNADNPAAQPGIAGTGVALRRLTVPAIVLIGVSSIEAIRCQHVIVFGTVKIHGQVAIRRIQIVGARIGEGIVLDTEAWRREIASLALPE